MKTHIDGVVMILTYHKPTVVNGELVISDHRLAACMNFLRYRLNVIVDSCVFGCLHQDDISHGKKSTWFELEITGTIRNLRYVMTKCVVCLT